MKFTIAAAALAATTAFAALPTAASAQSIYVGPRGGVGIGVGSGYGAGYGNGYRRGYEGPRVYEGRSAYERRGWRRGGYDGGYDRY